MNKILNDIKLGLDEQETIHQYVLYCYRIFVGLFICIPALAIIGFILGIIMFKNPIMAASETVNALF